MPKHSRKVKAGSFFSPERGAPRAADASDVLLIADEPRRPRRGRNGQGSASDPESQIEPLDMESVVRRLIALLSEESLP